MKQLKLCKNYQLLVLKYPQLQLWRNLSKKTVKKSPEKDMKLNLPNAGAFQLSMKNICQTEENIKKVNKRPTFHTYKNRKIMTLR